MTVAVAGVAKPSAAAELNAESRDHGVLVDSLVDNDSFDLFALHQGRIARNRGEILLGVVAGGTPVRGGR